MEPILEPEHRELEEALLRAGREVGMSADLQAKTLAALGITTAGVALTSTAKASAWSSVTGKAGAVWGGVVGLVGVGGAVVAVVASQGPETDQFAPNAARPQIVNIQEISPADPSNAQGEGQAQLDATVKGAVPASDPAADPLAAAEVSDQERGVPTRRDTRSNGGDSRSSVLREELSHISKVEAALRAGAQGEALSLLAVYRSRFTRPKLGLEAEVLTIQALYESGSVASAQQRARSFLQRYPKSPLGARAKRYLRE